MKYQVLLYYKYIEIKNPLALKDEQRNLCEQLSLKGRIIIAREGINGTVEGVLEKTEKYIKIMQKNPLFKDLSFKKSVGAGDAFPKLSVKFRPEIVASKLNVNPVKFSGKYLRSEELFQWFLNKKEFFVVDMRNDYEYQSGFFEGSLLPGIHNFYDLPQVLPKLSHLKDKTVVTVCTGGVRCEKASGFLMQNGFSDVYQLKDGIHSFIEKYPNKFFKGKLYVFDNRLTIGFNTNSPEHQVVGSCYHCGKSCDKYVNCAFDFCHYHYICCDGCIDKETNLSFCKSVCKRSFLSRTTHNLT